MKGTRYVLKNLGPQSSVYNPATKEYMIIVDGEPLDIPEKLFKTLFVEEPEEKPTEAQINVGLFSTANDAYEVLKKQVDILKNQGVDKETLERITLDAFSSDPMMQKFAKEILDSII